ncbi:acyl-CoA dehydrogenase [Rhodococcus sp. NPDC003318]|uniref:acyl-CoA dehydrogenase n=1 Tax=Rhodococcus sp. NPDC003318 TaxID=3364503 RepID=UPI0036BDB02E
MRSLDDARDVCEAYLPGLFDELDATPLRDLERPGNQGLDIFRKYGGSALVIPEIYSGLGAGPVDAIHVMRAIASRAPSLAVATAMHHFSVATLFTLADCLRSSGTEWAMLMGIAEQGLLVASGFAEGKPGQGILSPSVRGSIADGGYVVNGSKKPCSMARSMDLLSASTAVTDANGDTELILLLVPADSDGLSVHPFWQSDILAGAESDEVRLVDVFVDERLATRAEFTDSGEVDALQTVGFMWFEMLISACYLGMASGLVERVFAADRVGAEARAAIGVRLETATLLLERVAALLADGACDGAALTRAMIARYGAQDAINDAVGRAVEALGGISFITDPGIAYLQSATRCLSFHPPSRSSTHGTLAVSLAGGSFVLDR